MTRARHLIPVLFAVALAVSAQTPLPTQTITQPVTAATVIHPSVSLMPPPPPPSPVDFFRKLLAMTPVELAQSLTNRSPESRDRILAKVREYRAMPPNDRELRLRATELRWYLTPLFRMAPTDRATRLDQIPPELRDLINSRLAEWDALPIPTQQAMLTDAKTALPYFARVETNSAALDAEHQKIVDQFNRIFDLTPAEQSKCLASLSEAERAQMEKTLQSFQNLTPQQRVACIRNYARFTGMSASERADFLKNAERWSQMSPAERQTWRNLVAQVPEWPVLPPAVPPNMIPHPVKPSRPNMATNVN